MNSHYRVVIVGGGVVGASVLYHLAKFGWTDVALVERSVLTAGSSWHAAGGVHALNADPNMAALQAYTIDLLSEIEKESGQDIGLHMTGGITVASAPARWEWLQSAYRIFQTIGIEDCHLMTPDEIREKCPIMDVTGVIGGLWADREGYLDTTGTVHSVCRRGPQARRRGHRAQQGGGARAARRRHLERGDRKGCHPRRARRQRGRAVGEAGRAHGGARPSALAAAAPLLRYRIHPRDRRDGLRGADDGGPRRLHLHPAGPARGARRYLRGRPQALEHRWRAVGLRLRSHPRGDRSDCRGTRNGVAAVSRAGARGGQALGQRRLHILPGRKPAWSGRCRGCATTGSPAG